MLTTRCALVALAAVVLGLSGPTVESTTAGPIAAEHINKEWPAWSPDGRKIAYVGGNGGESRWHVYVMNVDGGRRRLVSAIEGGPPAWSPDGTKIAFGCSDGFFICVVDTNGGHVRQVKLSSLWDGGQPAWSPDGRLIAFVGSKAGGGPPGIYVMNADGSKRHRLVQHALRPTWSPDGQQIAFGSSDQDVIYVIDADSTARHPLARKLAAGHDPAWSPDGRAIAFVRGYGSALISQVSVMNADGRNPQRVTRTSGYDPAWSPDSGKIAFTSGGDIYVINADGTDLKRLT
jgi:Tol biopolymer transport system component